MGGGHLEPQTLRHVLVSRRHCLPRRPNRARTTSSSSTSRRGVWGVGVEQLGSLSAFLHLERREQMKCLLLERILKVGRPSQGKR